MSLEDIIAQVQSYGVNHVTVSGGEPLAQKSVIPLMQQLCDLGYSVSLETSGALDISSVDQRVMRILDLKTPASQESDKNLYANIDLLTNHDQVKFVVCNREDYDWSKGILDKYHLSERCEVLFSPSYHDLPAKDLADWIIEDRLPVRFQVQLHKILWGDVPGK